MKTPGVSLIAVARPMPTPAHRLPAGSSRSRSAATRNSSSMLTWPKLTVSRIGSNAAARQSATARANQRVQPARRATGSSSHQTSTALTTTRRGHADRDRHRPRQVRHRQHDQRRERRVGEAVLGAGLEEVVDLAAVVDPEVQRAVVDPQVEEAVPHGRHGEEDGHRGGEHRPPRRPARSCAWHPAPPSSPSLWPRLSCHGSGVRPPGASGGRRRDRPCPARDLAGRVPPAAAPARARQPGRGVARPAVERGGAGAALGRAPGAGRRRTGRAILSGGVRRFRAGGRRGARPGRAGARRWAPAWRR